MKLAVIKLGGRMNNNADGPVGGEVMSAIDLFVRGGNEVHYFTDINKKDIPLPKAVGHQIESFTNDYEALIVINGNVNYYGGQEPRLDLENIKLINKFKGPVFYILFDPMLPLKQQWKGVEMKQDKYKWEKHYSKEEIEIVRDDIVYISQPYNLEEVKKLIGPLEVKYKKLLHYPLYKMHLVFYDRLPFPKGHFFGRGELDERPIDVIYGGTFRSGKREKKLIKYYFGYPEKYNVEIFGKIELSHFNEKKIKGLRPPVFTKAIKHDQVRYKMMSSYSTVSIGDKWYEGRNLAQRIYESILSNCITFIDNDLDPQHLVYGDRLNKLYVNSKDGVMEVIDFVKQTDCLETTCDVQYETVKIDKEKFVNDLTELIGNNL